MRGDEVTLFPHSSLVFHLSVLADTVAAALFGVPEELRKAGLGKLTEELRAVVGRTYYQACLK